MDVRHLLATVDHGRITSDQFTEILPVASLWAHRNGAIGLDNMEQALAERAILEPSAFREMVRRAVPLSDSIRYAQIGHPETILIGSASDLPVEHQAEFEAIADQLTPNWSGDDWSPDIAVDLGELMRGMPLALQGDITGFQRFESHLPASQ